MKNDEIKIIAIYMFMYGLSKIMLILGLENAGKIISTLSDFVMFFGASFLILKNKKLVKRWIVYLIVSIVYSLGSFALKYSEEGIICLESPTRDLLTSLYFSIVTVTTLGYGDCHPSESARFYAASQAIFGVVMFGTIIAILLHVFNNISTENRKT